MTDETSAGATERLVARFPAPASERETSVAVVGDPHVAADETPGEKPATAEEYFRRALAGVEERGVDGVVSVGDLTANGSPESFEAVDRLLEDLPVPFASVPGNHDVPAASPGDGEVLPQREFEERYAGGSVPFVHRVGGVEVVGLDSVRLRRALGDGERAPQLEWLDEALPGLTAPVVSLHHPLPGMTDWLGRFLAHEEDASVERVWTDPDPLLDVLEARGVSLVLSGHLHTLGVASTRGVWEVMAPCLSAFPQAYLRLDVRADGTDVFAVPVADREETEADFRRRFTAWPKNRAYASAGAACLAGPPVDAR